MLSEELVDQFIEATKQEKEDYLMFRLVTEHGLTPGEIVGSHRHGSDLPGILIENLSDRSIWLKRAHKGENNQVPVGSELARKLRRLAGRRTKGKLFNINTETIARRGKQYAQEARIPNYPHVSPEALRNIYSRLANAQARLPLGEFEAKLVRDGERMGQFYTANFCIENTLRKLISETMKAKYGQSWWENIDPSIRAGVESRQEQELHTPMSERGADRLAYTMFRDLIGILEANWSDFSDKFKKTFSPVLQTLNHLNDLRNVIAHSGKLNDDEQRRFAALLVEWVNMVYWNRIQSLT